MVEQQVHPRRMDEELYTLDQYAHQTDWGEPHLTAFVKAYKRHMPEDPVQFKAERTVAQWDYELGLFIDVGGDAEEPIDG